MKPWTNEITFVVQQEEPRVTRTTWFLRGSFTAVAVYRLCHRDRRVPARTCRPRPLLAHKQTSHSFMFPVQICSCPRRERPLMVDAPQVFCGEGQLGAVVQRSSTVPRALMAATRTSSFSGAFASLLLLHKPLTAALDCDLVELYCSDCWSPSVSPVLECRETQQHRGIHRLGLSGLADCAEDSASRYASKAQTQMGINHERVFVCFQHV